MHNFESIYQQVLKRDHNVSRPDGVYFVGIKGVGMTALALIAHQAGLAVRGCDVDETFITDEALSTAGIPVDTGFSPTDFADFADKHPNVLVIITGAHQGFNNPVARYASDQGFIVCTQGQAVGLFMDGGIFGRDDIEGLSVCGSHGKTTITGMCATVMKALGADPSYVVGTGELYPLGLPGHYGHGKYFVAEADEYASDIHADPTPKLYYQHPRFVILNNIDFDHPDFYASIDGVEEMFSVFLHNLPKTTQIFINGDDDRLRKIASTLDKERITTYGVGHHNDYAINHVIHAVQMSFTVMHHGEELGEFSLQVIGEHNALNALSVIAFARSQGYSERQIQDALAQFGGSKRRLEVMGTMKDGTIVVDDYAHHPKEITTSLHALRTAYPDYEISCIFQPHTYSRTRSLLSEFSSSFSDIDTLLLLPVFASARETEVDTTIDQDLREGVQKTGVKAHLFSDHARVIEYLTQNRTHAKKLYVTMGAGDVYHVAEKLILQ